MHPGKTRRRVLPERARLLGDRSSAGSPATLGRADDRGDAMVAETALTELPTGPEELGPLALHAHLAGAGRWERFTYSGPAGSRRYFVYTPARYTLDQRVPMVVMLH